MMMKNAEVEDYPVAYEYIRQLWDYNNYEPDTVKDVYSKILEDENSFAFFLIEDGVYRGFCHGCYFQTFWLSGLTCYISSLFTRAEDRGRGYGTALLDHAKKLAEKRGCRGMVLDSGLPRISAHKFYENYGFKKNCYGFDFMLDDTSGTEHTV